MGLFKYRFELLCAFATVFTIHAAKAAEKEFSPELLSLRGAFVESEIPQKIDEVQMDVWWDCQSWFGRAGSSGSRRREAYFRFEKYSKAITINVGSNSVSLFKVDPKVGFVGDDAEAGLKVVLRKYAQGGWIVEFSGVPQLLDDPQNYLTSTVDSGKRVLNYVTCNPRPLN